MTKVSSIVNRPRAKSTLIARTRVFLFETNQSLAEMSTFDVCAIVTLVLLFLYVGEHWYLTTPIKALCLLGLFLPRLRRNPLLWYAAFILMCTANYFDRLLIDNHKYLMTYWIVAMIFAASKKGKGVRDHVLRYNGRILIGLAFSFAVLAKFLSADYLTGGFFRSTLELDSRFSNLATLVGGLDPHALAEVRRSASDLKSAYLLNMDGSQVLLLTSRRLSILVWFMTIWTIVIESAVAISYMWPWPSKICDWGRRYCLWLFLFTTYAIAFVPGFAWTLTVMGLAAMPKAQARFRIVYILLVAVVLQVYQLPWVSLIKSYWK